MAASNTFCDLETLGEAQYGFLTGTAGTGKTTVARRWAADHTAVLCATTGIAAINLSDATTINTLLGYFNTKSLEEQHFNGYLLHKLRGLYRSGIRRIVLDEVSMMDADQLTILTQAIEACNGETFDVFEDDAADEATVKADLEGDPLGLMLVGDFCQLSPVKAPYAFTSPEWGRYDRNTCLLSEIHRQDDRDFIEALQAIRRGDKETALAYFVSRLEPSLQGDFEGTTILAKNDAVSRFNNLRLSKLETDTVRFPSSRWGKVRSEWGTEKQPKAKWGVPEMLILKEGCLVMLLANKYEKDDLGGRPKLVYVNGDLGTFLTDDHGQATVKLQRTGEEVDVEWICRDNLIALEPGRRKALKAAGQQHLIKGKYEVVGQITYMPMRVAYASTVHKSQGLTLDTVQVNLRDAFFRTPGMLYVALSRARTPEGLHVIGTPNAFVDRVRTDPKVAAWL